MRRLLFVALVLSTLAGQVRAEPDLVLQLDYETGPESATSPASPMLLAMNDVAPLPEAPLKLEYRILLRVEYLADTVREIQRIVLSMPGPSDVGQLAQSLPMALPPIGQYHTVIEETLARLSRIEMLVADVSRLIKALPVAHPNAGTSRHAAHPETIERHKNFSWPGADSIVWTALMATLVVAFTFAWLRWTGKPGAKGALLPKPAVSKAVTSAVAKQSVAPVATTPVGSEPSSDKSYAHTDGLREPGQPGPSVQANGREALELAEIMVSMGLTEGAANTLVEQIRLNPNRALPHWLKLLEIYHRSGMREKYDQSARELNSRFNVQAGGWKPGASLSRSESLEDYPRIISHIVEDWRKPECYEYLAGLLEDNRGGTRAGFPAPVAEEILLLLSLLQE